MLALYLFYYALLRNETGFRFNRLYLLLSPIVALSLPLVTWPALLLPDTAVAQALQAIQLREVTVLSYKQGDGGVTFLPYLSPVNMIVSLYLLVALYLVYKLCRQLWHIYKLKSKAESIIHTPEGVQIIQLKQHYSSFAFLNYVFLSSQEQLTSREKKQVLAHELAHVQLGHTYDILFYELLSIVLWFNPVIWLLKQALRNVHEFQADASVLEQHQPQEYSTLLSKEVLFNMGLPIGSHFQKPQVLQRLQMLGQYGKRPNWLKSLLILPLLVVLLCILTSQRATGDISFQSDPLAPTPDQALEGSDKDRNISIQKDNAQNLIETKPYTYVEQMPQFKGGEMEMLRYLGINIRYPQEAQEAGHEGLVVISFVVEPDGSLSDVQVIKKLGMGTDEEAMRVVKQMSGNWEPGMQNGTVVPVRYTLPIRFEMK